MKLSTFAKSNGKVNVYGTFSKIYFHQVGLPLKKKEETVTVDVVVYCKTEGEREKRMEMVGEMGIERGGGGGGGGERGRGFTESKTGNCSEREWG